MSWISDIIDRISQHLTGSGKEDAVTTRYNAIPDPLKGEMILSPLAPRLMLPSTDGKLYYPMINNVLKSPLKTLYVGTLETKGTGVGTYVQLNFPDIAGCKLPWKILTITCPGGAASGDIYITDVPGAATPDNTIWCGNVGAKSSTPLNIEGLGDIYLNAAITVGVCVETYRYGKVDANVGFLERTDGYQS